MWGEWTCWLKPGQALEKQKTHRFECADVSPDVKRALRRPTITGMKGHKSISKRFMFLCEDRLSRESSAVLLLSLGVVVL